MPMSKLDYFKKFVSRSNEEIKNDFFVVDLYARKFEGTV